MLSWPFRFYCNPALGTSPLESERFLLPQDGAAVLKGPTSLLIVSPNLLRSNTSDPYRSWGWVLIESLARCPCEALLAESV